MNKKINKNEKKQKIKSVLKRVLNVFCYVVTAFSLLLAVLMTIFSCSNKDDQIENSRLSSKQKLNDVGLYSSFGNFSFHPYKLPEINDAPNLTISTYDNNYRYVSNIPSNDIYFDVFVCRYDSIYKFYAELESAKFIYVFYNGDYYKNQSFELASNYFRYGGLSVSVSQDYIVVLPYMDTYDDEGTDITLHGVNNSNNFYDYFTYYCSFLASSFNEQFNTSVDDTSYDGLISVFTLQSQLILNTKYENYTLDNRKFIFNPLYKTNNYWTCYFPLTCTDYYYDSVDTLVPFTSYFNSISYGTYWGSASYVSCIGTKNINYYYNGDNLSHYGDSYTNDLFPLENLFINSFNFSYWTYESMPTINKGGTRWQYEYSYHIYEFRGYFPKSLNDIHYLDLFLPISNSVLNFQSSFDLSAHTLDIAYTEISGSYGSVYFLFNNNTHLTVNNRMWYGISSSDTSFTFMTTTSFVGDTGPAYMKNEIYYDQRRIAVASSLNVNDYLYLLRSSYNVESTLPNYSSGDDASIINAIDSIFSLLSTAFNGFIPMLNISLGSGITLGVLVFLPLIASLVFVIVRLFKR